MRGVCALNMETMAALKLENGDDAAGADFKATAAFPIIEKAASSLRYGLIEGQSFYKRDRLYLGNIHYISWRLRLILL